MPNRILREGILDSERINALSIKAELFYRRLMSIVDDYGRWEANPIKLRGKLFYMRLDETPISDVEQMLAECTRGDGAPVVLYEVMGRRYLQISDFKQQTRTPSKFPGPNDGHLISIDSELQQVKSSAHLGVVVSVSEVVCVVDKQPSVAVATAKPRPQKAAPSRDEIIENLQGNDAFKHLDVRSEYARCCAWCESNGLPPPSVKRFTNWLLKAKRDAPMGEAIQRKPFAVPDKRDERNQKFMEIIQDQGVLSR